MKKQKIILIVEDEKSLREALFDILTRKGFSAFQAKNGREGLGAALQEKPDIILLDVIMPEMDGMAMLDALREDPWGKNVPVIILTNKSASDEKLVKEMVTVRPMFYLIKSDWQIHDVVQKVEEVLSLQ